MPRLRAIAILTASCILLWGCGQAATPPKPTPLAVCGFITAPPSVTAGVVAVSQSDAEAAARDFLVSHVKQTSTITCKAKSLARSSLNTYLIDQVTTPSVWVVVARGGMELANAASSAPSASLAPTPTPSPVVAIVFFVSAQSPAQIYRISVYRTPLPTDLAAIG